ncbi:prepilin-type N-terminal cleavage/methylation domain-containing protein [Candidatus Peregrinibacteria bacterium]|nr:prepilin-type N-terminal cleavage/methylation domain-containing protein [Candidatus Peregrinibacteria bacterium]
MQTGSRGFTLIELLLVVAILFILAAIVIVALNTPQQLSSLRDMQRKEDVNMIISAVTNYMVATNGKLPGNIPNDTPKEICRWNVAPADCEAEGGVNLRTLSGTYLEELPMDPQAPKTGTGTYYTIVRGRDRRLTVSAWNSELSETPISETR